MAKPFVPIDLSEIYNAGTRNAKSSDGSLLWPAPEEDPDRTPLRVMPTGDCLFWGIPFKLAEAEVKKGLVVVAQEGKRGVQDRVTIPIGQKAKRLLFAHASAPHENQPTEGMGETIGVYRIVFEDGSAVEQTLRRRFEIHDVIIPWGHHPFLCRNCREFRSVPIDYRGMDWGWVQTGVTTENGGDMQGWWIYDWENCAPEKEIQEVEVIASGTTAMALGGITLCQEDGDPFAWPPREVVALTIDRKGKDPVEVEMERGVVARQDQLFVPTGGYLRTDETGWGRGGQEVKDGQYLEIHGSAEGELRVKAGEEVEESFRWGDVVEKKKVGKGRVNVQLVAPEGKQWVHVQVLDEDSGQQVGSRVHFRTPHGAYLAPHGHQADVNVGWFEDVGGDVKTAGTPYAYVDGKCQIELPVGEVYVELVRGFEYEPVRKKIEIKPGQRHLNLKVKRAFDMKERGYYSGDTHVHFLSSQSAHLEAAAEDLNVVNLLASQWGRLFTNWKDFSGGLAPTSSDEHKIWVSQENRQHVLGHISLLGLKDLVAPICSGGPDEDWVGGEVQVLLADWAEQCRAQGGMVVIPHMPLPDFENAANVILGLADAGEMCWVWQGEKISSAERGYYRWLNVGQKLPVVGGTDKMANNRVVGGSRTYARLREGEEFTYENWCQAVRRGSTFASTGAVIDLKVDGKQMGEEIHLPGNGGTVEVEAVAESVWPLSGIELIVNGEEVAREVAQEGERRIEIKFKLKTELSCWVVARCWGPHFTDAGPVMAHSSPVYVDVGNRCAFVPTEGNYLLTHMEGGIAWAEKLGVFRDESVRTRLIRLFRQAQDELRRRVE